MESESLNWGGGGGALLGGIMGGVSCIMGSVTSSIFLELDLYKRFSRGFLASAA